jgi:hypothetical protein
MFHFLSSWRHKTGDQLIWINFADAFLPDSVRIGIEDEQSIARAIEKLELIDGNTYLAATPFVGEHKVLHAIFRVPIPMENIPGKVCTIPSTPPLLARQ